MSEAAPHPGADLTGDDRARLEAAHHELREAVAAYEHVSGVEIRPGEAPPLQDAAAMRAAQERVQAAEDRLWELREQLLGWVRPAWAPSAALTADWFSEEDTAYDDLPETTVS